MTGPKPRRALVEPADDFAALDDHQQLLVALEALATEWTGRAIDSPLFGPGNSDYRRCAEQLRSLARQHSTPSVLPRRRSR